MSINQFQSHLASPMDDFVAYKQVQGYSYQGSIKQLRAFDHFLTEQSFQQPYLTAQVAAEYLAHTQAFSPNTRQARRSTAREFSRYLHLLEPRSQILQNPPARRQRLPRFYLFKELEIAALMQAARGLATSTALRPHTYATLLGLLAVTGLRIDEALSLDLSDLMLDDELLVVRKGKFGKDRLLPLADSTGQALHRYLTHRLDFGLQASTDPFFISGWGRRLSYSSAAKTFKTLLRQCRIGDPRARPPRLHDLRHTFATRSLLKWYQEGQDVNTKLPLLATYMGHVSLQSTQVYLHVCSLLLAEANTRFQNAFQPRIQL